MHKCKCLLGNRLFSSLVFIKYLLVYNSIFICDEMWFHFSIKYIVAETIGIECMSGTHDNWKLTFGRSGRDGHGKGYKALLLPFFYCICGKRLLFFSRFHLDFYRLSANSALDKQLCIHLLRTNHFWLMHFNESISGHVWFFPLGHPNWHHQTAYFFPFFFFLFSP